LTTNEQLPILAASVCVRRGDDVLLIKRGSEPGKGKWAFPGGKVQWGETTQHAALRELREEAGITAQVGPLIGLYEVIHNDVHFAIACYLAIDPTGEVVAGSDAADARWIGVDQISELPLAANISHALSASFKLHGLR
jgi:8-oxo-dGTP diphosphatase